MPLTPNLVPTPPSVVGLSDTGLTTTYAPNPEPVLTPPPSLVGLSDTGLTYTCLACTGLPSLAPLCRVGLPQSTDPTSKGSIFDVLQKQV